MSFSLRLLSDQPLMRGERAQEVAEIVGEGMKLKEDGVGGEERHESRVHRIAPLPSLIHCSQVPVVEGDDICGGLAMLVTMKPTRGQSSPECHSTLATTRRGFVRFCNTRLAGSEWRM
jgi:hypothetical protein